MDLILSEFLIKKGYLVHGVKRRSSSFNTGRIDHIYQDPMIKIENLFYIMVMLLMLYQYHH